MPSAPEFWPESVPAEDIPKHMRLTSLGRHFIGVDVCVDPTKDLWERRVLVPLAHVEKFVEHTTRG